MARPVELACFSARYLSLLQRFPNKLHEHSALIMQAPDAPGVVIFAVSHAHHAILLYDAKGFCAETYEFDLSEEFFSAISPMHLGLGKPKRSAPLRFALSVGEYRLYEGAVSNEQIFDPSHDSAVRFKWAAGMHAPSPFMLAAVNNLLRLHQSDVPTAAARPLRHAYMLETEYLQQHIGSSDTITVRHRWVRDGSAGVKCLTQFESQLNGPGRIEALLCVDAETAMA